MNLAPIVLFVYNRPKHTEQTLKALAENECAVDSVLYIYADGAKENASAEVLAAIKETRAVIRKQKWCKEIHIIESEKNKGLANSVIEGVTAVINKYGKAIILEDDLITAKGFLKYINEALELYDKSEMVSGISGWSFSIKVEDETYFSKVGACWGWGTWKRVWENVNFSGMELKELLQKQNRINEFNIENAYDFYGMLNRQIAGEIDSWAVRFYANYFLKNGLFLFPKKNLVQNIGFDGSGTHYKTETTGSPVFFEKQFVDLKYIKPIEKKSVRRMIIQSFNSNDIKTRSLFNRVISKIKKRLCV